MTIRDMERMMLGHRADPHDRGKPPWSQRKIELFFWLLAILVTLVIMLHKVSWPLESGAMLFMGWAILPYVVVCRFVSNAFRSRHDRSVIWIGRVVSGLLLVGTVFVYADTLSPPTSSTSALVFVFFPLWLFLGGSFFLALAISALKWRREDHLLPSHCEKCGYNLTGNVTGVCPECGLEIERP